MSNITAYPLQDWFETTLAQSWNGAIGTVYLNTAPSFTFPSGVKTYIVVNPWKTNMQVGEIDSLHVWNKTVNVSSISVGSWAGTTYTQESHSVWSTVIISDNYQFWKNIIDAVNSKMDLSGGTFTGDVSFSWTGTEFRLPNLTTAERLALTPWNGTIVYDSTLWENYQYIAWAWNAFAAWSTQPNASTTVAGKVEIATTAEMTAGTATGWTWASLVGTPADTAAQIQSNSWNYGVDVWGDDTYVVALTPVLTAYTTGQELKAKLTTANTGACTIDFWPWVKNIKTTNGIDPPTGSIIENSVNTFVYDGTNMILQNTGANWPSKFWGTGEDGAVDGTAAVTITGSNSTYIVKNYTSRAAGSAARILTITPTNCLLHIKIQGNCDLTNWTFSFNGKGWQGWAQVTGTGQKTGTDWEAGANLIVGLVNALGGKVNPAAGSVGTWGWGWAGITASGTNWVFNAIAWGTGAAKAVFGDLNTIIAGRRYVMYIGSGGGSGGIGSGASGSPVGGAGGSWGWAVILEVAGNLTLDNGTTVINMNGTNGANWVAGTNAGAGWGWGWGGWTFLAIYNWTLTGTVTPTVAAGAAWNGANGASTQWSNGWPWWAWDYLITQNTVFS